MKTFEGEFDKFILSGMRNQWLATSLGQIYVRNSTRLIQGEMIRAVDIANIAIKEKHQGQGAFKRFLGHLEALRAFDAIYIENVLNERLVTFLDQRGYTRFEQRQSVAFVPSFFKLIGESDENAHA